MSDLGSRAGIPHNCGTVPSPPDYSGSASSKAGSPLSKVLPELCYLSGFQFKY